MLTSNGTLSVQKIGAVKNIQKSCFLIYCRKTQQLNAVITCTKRLLKQMTALSLISQSAIEKFLHGMTCGQLQLSTVSRQITQNDKGTLKHPVLDTEGHPVALSQDLVLKTRKFGPDYQKPNKNMKKTSIDLKFSAVSIAFIMQGLGLYRR